MKTPSDNNPFRSLWDPVVFTLGECRLWEIGPVRFWIRRTPLEWRLSYEYQDELEDRFKVAAPCSVPDNRTWERWAVREDHLRLELEPVLPDRPVIVRPDSLLQVPPGERVHFFAGLPFWIRIGEKGKLILRELPTRILSNSWFGDTTQGEACYASVTSARRTLDEMHHKAFRAVSAIEVRNDFREPLALQRICVRGAYLNLYQGEHYFWTTEHRIVYLGPIEPSRLVLGRGGPASDQATQRIGNARETLRRKFFTRSLGTLMPLTI